jgi:DNA-directed RNA polymerase subunit RPC12/RpoP
MVKVCLKCGKEFDEKLIDDPGSEIYPSCPYLSTGKRFENTKRRSLVWKNQKVNYRKILINVPRNKTAAFII